MPQIFLGGFHADVRGSLRFCNDFDMSAVKRFYTIANSVDQPVRGWIGHKRETKWFFPLKGTTEIVVEPMEDLNAEARNRPSRGLATLGEANTPSEASAERRGGFLDRIIRIDRIKKGAGA